MRPLPHPLHYVTRQLGRMAGCQSKELTPNVVDAVHDVEDVRLSFSLLLMPYRYDLHQARAVLVGSEGSILPAPVWLVFLITQATAMRFVHAGVMHVRLLHSANHNTAQPTPTPTP